MVVHCGEKMRELRERRGMSQADVAKEMGISQAWVSKMEGRRKGAVEDLELYAAACGVRLRLEFEDNGAVKAPVVVVKDRLEDVEVRLELPAAQESKVKKAAEKKYSFPGDGEGECPHGYPSKRQCNFRGGGCRAW